MNPRRHIQRQTLEERVAGVDLTLKDVIDIIAGGCKVEAIRFVQNPYHPEETLMGTYSEEGGREEILIDSGQAMDDKRMAVIHEFYHALYRRKTIRRRTIKEEEDEMEFLTKKKLKELYNLELL